jgi:hypothetical protein
VIFKKNGKKKNCLRRITPTGLYGEKSSGIVRGTGAARSLILLASLNYIQIAPSMLFGCIFT